MEIIPYSYSTFFPASFTKAYIDYVNANVDGNLLFIQENEIVLPLLVRNKMKFKIGYFVYPPQKIGQRLTKTEEADFFKTLTQFLKKNKIADFILPPLHLENFQHLPLNSIGNELGIIVLELENRTEDQIFQSFKPVYRRHIRNAEKSGVEVKFGLEYFDDFYTIYSEKLKQENAVYDSYETIKKLAFNSENELSVQCGVVYLNGKIEAGIVNISDHSTAYYFWGGSSKNAHNGSFRLLHWELIKYYKSIGLKKYKLGAFRKGDMLTEKHERLASFKLGFGSEVQEGFHFTLIVNSLKYRIFKGLMNAKNKLKK